MVKDGGENREGRERKMGHDRYVNHRGSQRWPWSRPRFRGRILRRERLRLKLTCGRFSKMDQKETKQRFIPKVTLT